MGKDELYFFDEGCGLTAQVELELKRKLHFANPTLSTSNEQDPFSGIKYLQTLMAKETSVDELELCLALEFCQFQTAYRKDAVNQLHPLVLLAVFRCMLNSQACLTIVLSKSAIEMNCG